MDPGGKIYTTDQFRCWKVENLDKFKQVSNNLLYNDFIVNIYTIGLGTSFYNLLVPLHTNTVILIA